MIKFKNEPTGYIAIPTMANDKYKIESMPQYTLPKNLVENSKDWVEIFEPKFKNGDVAETYSGAIFLITDVENNRGYGFSSNGIWFSENNLNINLKNDNLKLSTSDKWLEALTKEAVKRGFKKNCKANNSKIYNCKISDYEFEKGFFKLINNVLVWINELDNETDYWTLMKDGIWAEVVKEETLDELVERFYKFNISNQNTTYDNYKTFFTKNKETIHRLSK